MTLDPVPIAVQAISDFVVTRRVEWEDGDEIRRHLDEVVDALHDYEEVLEVEMDVDLSQGRVRMSLICAVLPDEDADLCVRRAAAAAIRQGGGRHDGLLPLAEEARVRANVNAWSGLRTPRWEPRRFAVQRVVAD
jgi:hypothetical protein